MYSPKIRDELIPKIYRVAKRAGIHMTTWVNDVLAKALSETTISEETNQWRKNFKKEKNDEARTVHEERRES